MLFYPLYYDILTSLNITQAFHLLLGFTENQAVYWDFKIQNSVWITKGSDNRGSTVLPIVIHYGIINMLLDYNTGENYKYNLTSTIVLCTCRVYIGLS